MPKELEKVIKAVYRKWKAGQPQARDTHPDDEDLALFLERSLPKESAEGLVEHLINCAVCMEKVAVQLNLRESEAKTPSPELIQRIKGLVSPEAKSALLEIFLRLKEKALELLNTTGDVLMGQELIPAPVLRSRQIKDFPDQVVIFKDFKDIRVEAKIENKRGQAFSLAVTVREKITQKLMKDLRVTLIREGVELESYLSGSGRVIFEYIYLGKYTVEISDIEEKLASILLDIKK